MADTYALLAHYAQRDPKVAYAEARKTAETALVIDDSVAEVHASLGLVKLLYDWDWSSAEAEFRRAIELDRNYVPARVWYANYLAASGHSDRAIKQVEQVRMLDPLSEVSKLALGTQYYFARQYDKARVEFEKLLDKESDLAGARLNLGLVYAQQSLLAKSIEELELANKQMKDDIMTQVALGHVYGLAGEKHRAKEILNRLEGQAKTPAISFAVVYAGMGEKDQAFQYLERAFEEHEANLMFLNVEPYFDNLRSDQRFAILQKRIGLPTAATTSSGK